MTDKAVPTGPENKSATQHVIERIQDLILSGKLAPGDKLPPERQMTELLKVGRPALREGLKALELMGIVQRRQGSGNYITSNMRGHFFKPLSLAYKLEGGNVDDVLHLRYALEVFSVQQACKNADDTALQTLRRVHGELPNTADIDSFIHWDRQFHLTIAKISGNMLVVTFLDSISYLLDSLFRQTVAQAMSEDGTYNIVYKEHGRILAALEKRDSVLAAQAMQNHFGRIDQAFSI